jgi:signal transduction histidine kinase
VIALSLILLLGTSAVLLLLSKPEHRVDLAKINDITKTLANDFDNLRGANYSLPGKDEMEYAVTDVMGNLIITTRPDISPNIYDALTRGDTIVDITKNGQIVGKAIFPNNSNVIWNNYLTSLRLIAIIILATTALISFLFCFDLYKQILRPFKKMQGFAQRVAAGELEVPLGMSEKNAFGAFTESFDLMRDELKRARDNEQMAEQSKRDLITSLSHDIHTPIISIKAVAELMEATTTDEYQRKKLQIIQGKTDQTNALLTDLFNAAMKEQGAISVNPTALGTDQLAEIIEKADYKNLTTMGSISSCLLRADPVRLAQVIDNIMLNSYKYANTAIDIATHVNDDGFTITFRDYGPGVKREELDLVFSKHYRGENAEGKEGYGLGLFISHSLIERMDGNIRCMNAEPGLIVEIWLQLYR